MTSLRSVFALTMSGALLMAACGSDDDSASSSVPAATATVNVISSSEPISQLLGEVYGQALENAGFRIGRKNPVADQTAAFTAVESGASQLTVETTVSLLTRLDSTLLAIPTTIDEQTTALNDALPDTLAANPVSGVDVGLVVACTADAVETHGLTDLSSLSAVAGDITLGMPEGFGTATPVGLGAIASVYETEFPKTVTVDTDGIADAVTERSFDCVVAPRVTPAITLSGLLPLDDDKSALPVDMVVPLVGIATSTPELVSMLTTINASLTTDVVRALLVKVDNGTNTFDTAAKAFLASLSTSG